MPVDVSNEAFQVSSSSEGERRAWFERLQGGPLAFRMRTRRLDVEPHGGPFSIKTVFKGRETYIFDDKRVHLAPCEILLVAPETTYASSINSRDDTDSFSVFVPGKMVRASGDGPLARLLDHGLGAVNLAGQSLLHRRLAALACALEWNEALAIDEGFVQLWEQLGQDCDALSDACETIDASTPGRRAELLRRVLRVKAMLDDSPGEGHSLADLATTACLSQYHLLRVFKSAFGLTPAQYLISLRMMRAATLLASSNRSERVAAIARDCGYANLSAFGRAFRRHWGCAPIAFTADTHRQNSKIGIADPCIHPPVALRVSRRGDR